MTRVRYPMIPMLFEASLITQPRNSPPAFSSRKIQSWKQPRHERSEERTCFFYSGKKGGKQMEARILGMYDKYMYSSGLHRFVFVTKKMVIIFKILA